MQLPTCDAQDQGSIAGEDGYKGRRGETKGEETSDTQEREIQHCLKSHLRRKRNVCSFL